MPLVDDPDEIITCDPGYCDGCGADVSGAPAVGMQRRQVVDVPACAAGQTALDGISTNSARAGPLAAVQSYLSTATKWGLDHYDVLYQLFTTGAWLPLAAEPC